jgi:hypothetical protein
VAVSDSAALAGGFAGGAVAGPAGVVVGVATARVTKMVATELTARLAGERQRERASNALEHALMLIDARIRNADTVRQDGFSSRTQLAECPRRRSSRGSCYAPLTREERKASLQPACVGRIPV